MVTHASSGDFHATSPAATSTAGRPVPRSTAPDARSSQSSPVRTAGSPGKRLRYSFVTLRRTPPSSMARQTTVLLPRECSSNQKATCCRNTARRTSSTSVFPPEGCAMPSPASPSSPIPIATCLSMSASSFTPQRPSNTDSPREDTEYPEQDVRGPGRQQGRQPRVVPEGAEDADHGPVHDRDHHAGGHAVEGAPARD